jgi:hypothetical protein
LPQLTRTIACRQTGGVIAKERTVEEPLRSAATTFVRHSHVEPELRLARQDEGA